MSDDDIKKAIAIEVMGWGKSPDKAYDHQSGYISAFGPHIWDGRDFSPSTDIADAWRVVERMRGLGWLIILRPCDEAFYFDENEIGASAPGWSAEIRRPETDEARPEAFEEDVGAPLAICKAALAAVRAMKGAEA